MSNEGILLYKNRGPDGQCNLCGRRVAALRKALGPKVSQRVLADKLQVVGIDIDKNAVQRIESGKRFVTDIELQALAEVFGVTADELLSK